MRLAVVVGAALGGGAPCRIDERSGVRCEAERDRALDDVPEMLRAEAAVDEAADERRRGVVRRGVWASGAAEEADRAGGRPTPSDAVAAGLRGVVSARARPSARDAGRAVSVLDSAPVVEVERDRLRERVRLDEAVDEADETMRERGRAVLGLRGFLNSASSLALVVVRGGRVEEERDEDEAAGVTRRARGVVRPGAVEAGAAALREDVPRLVAAASGPAGVRERVSETRPGRLSERRARAHLGLGRAGRRAVVV